MKKLLLLPFLALFSSFLFAQDTPDDFANRVRYIFQHVDASQASTGILLDCGVEFVNMDNHTGYTTLNDSNYVNLNIWRGVYASLYSSKFNSNINFTDFPTINSSIGAATADTLPVPLLLLNYNYQVLRADAISANLMYASNDQLYDVSNRIQSPYTSKTAFAISSAEDYIKSVNGYASFIFKSSLLFGNTGKTISTLKIDLGDGQGWRTVQPDVAINTQYSSGGFKIFNYEVTYTDSSVYTGHSRIYIDYQQETYSPGGGNLSDQFYPIADGDSYSGGFRLREIRNGVNIQTYNMNLGTNYSSATDFSDNNNNDWTAAEYNNTNLDNAALDAHWGLEILKLTF